MKNSPANKSGSFIKEDKGDECERCKVKNSKVRCTHNHRSGLLQTNSSQISLRGESNGMLSKIEINDTNRINLFPAPLNNGSQKNLTERYGGSSTGDATTPAGPMGGETEMELLKFMTTENLNANNTPDKGDTAKLSKLDKELNNE